MKLKHKVRLLQYSALLLLVFTGWAFSTHWVLGVIFFVYGNWLNAQGYKHFKDFLREKWKIKE